MKQDIIAITNQKGGVGKTTTTVNLAAAIALANKKVLVIDADPQGNASTAFGITQNQRENNIYNLIAEQTTWKKAIRGTNIKGLDIIPATQDLSALEVELSTLERREYRLKDTIKKIKTHYDYIFIDCPPSLGLITINALNAANNTIIPLQCEYYALEGLSQLMKTMEAVRRHQNPELEIKGIVLTMYDRRNKLSEMVAKDVRKHLESSVYKTIIPRNVRVSEAPSHGKSVLLYDIKSTGAQAYIELAAEVIKQET